MEVMDQGIKFLCYGLVFGLSLGLFLPLVASAFCAVVHTIKSVMNGGR